MIFRIVLALAYVRRSLTRYAEAAAGPRLKSRIGCFLALRKSARYGRVLRGKGRRCGLGAAVWRAALKTWTLKNALHGVVIMGDAPPACSTSHAIGLASYIRRNLPGRNGARRSDGYMKMPPRIRIRWTSPTIDAIQRILKSFCRTPSLPAISSSI